VASLSQGRTAAAQCGLFTYKSVPVIFEPPCISIDVPCQLNSKEQRQFVYVYTADRTNQLAVSRK